MSFGEMWDNFVSNLPSYAIGVAKFVIMAIIGLMVIKLTMFLLRRGLNKTKLEKVVISFALSCVRVALYITYAVILFNSIDIPMGSIATIMGALSVVLGIALKDSTSSLASGVSIIVNKPFKQGDFVKIGGESGTVEAITIMNIKLRTAENKLITIPNNHISSTPIINLSGQGTRRLDIVFSVAYGSNVDDVKDIIITTVNKSQYTLQAPTVVVYLKEQAASALHFEARIWVKSEHYMDATYIMSEMVYRALISHKINVPFNQLDVHIKDNVDLLKGLKNILEENKEEVVEVEKLVAMKKLVSEVAKKSIPVVTKKSPLGVVKKAAPVVIKNTHKKA